MCSSAKINPRKIKKFHGLAKPQKFLPTNISPNKVFYWEKFSLIKYFAVEAIQRNFYILREFILADKTISQFLQELIFANTNINNEKDSDKQRVVVPLPLYKTNFTWP